MMSSFGFAVRVILALENEMGRGLSCPLTVCMGFFFFIRYFVQFTDEDM